MKVLMFICGVAAAMLVSAGVLEVAGCVSSFFYRTVFIVVLLATFSASGESEVFKLSEQSPISTCEARYLKSKWRTRRVEASQGMSLKELQKEVPSWVKEAAFLADG